MGGFGQLDLWRLAGKRSYERGEGYLDAVTGLRGIGDGVRATVHGTEPYRVSLSWADNQLAGSCSCPHGSAGAFCKHCVAVGLRWIDQDDESVAPPTTEIRAYLESLDRQALVDLLCDHAADNEWLYEDLSSLAADSNTRSSDTAGPGRARQ